MKVQALAQLIVDRVNSDDHPEIVGATVKGKGYQYPHVLATINFASGATATVQALRVVGKGVSGPEYTVPDRAW